MEGRTATRAPSSAFRAGGGMGRTRSGNTYEPDKERPDDFFSCAVPSPPLISAIGHADNFFSCAVLSPPLIAHHVRPAQENTWSQVWEPEAKSRSILEVMAESLSRAGLDNNDTTTNGAARAACFLARLCTTSRAMRHMAGSCELWRSLLAMSFGPEYYAQTSLSLQTARGPFMEFEIYAQLTSELREYPSHFFRSIMLHRDGRARAQTFDLRAGALPFRELSISERSRVALWVPRFTLVDEGSFELSGISPRSLPKVSSMKASSLARLVQHAKPIRRQVTFHAPSGYAFCTVDVLLDAVSRTPASGHPARTRDMTVALPLARRSEPSRRSSRPKSTTSPGRSSPSSCHTARHQMASRPSLCSCGRRKILSSHATTRRRRRRSS